jgi:hypothetical protein
MAYFKRMYNAKTVIVGTFCRFRAVSAISIISAQHSLQTDASMICSCEMVMFWRRANCGSKHYIPPDTLPPV